MKPSIGRIVHYTLGGPDAAMINTRRKNAADHIGEHRDNATGVVVHTGNTAREGDVYPLLITRVWNTDPGTVNGQVLLDGNDSLWVTSTTPGEGPGRYAWPERTA